MRWQACRNRLCVCALLIAAAAGCKLYRGELLSSQATPGVGKRAADGGGLVGSDATSAQRCGDGEISGPEKCDVGIASGESGACPTECPALGSCAPRALNGTACQAECLLLDLTCGPRDGCCPADCLSNNDVDCSTACGDGVVDAERGETCEPKSDAPCPASVEDCADDDPCTTDRLLGSAQNCNALCVHLPISVRKSNDGCCPAGANATQDADCAGCAASCEGSAADSGADAGPNDALCGVDVALTGCQRCSCDRCSETYLACRLGPNAEENQRCSAVLDCSERARCTGDTCYCGSVPTIPTCLIPSGPCQQEIELAAGTTDQMAIRNLSRDPATVLGRATAAGTCRSSECNGECFVAR